MECHLNFKLGAMRVDSQRQFKEFETQEYRAGCQQEKKMFFAFRFSFTFSFSVC